MKHVLAAIVVLSSVVVGLWPESQPIKDDEPVVLHLSDASLVFKAVAEQDRDAEFLLLMVKQLVDDGVLTDKDAERFDKAITSISGGRGLHFKLTAEERKVLSLL